jgi:hypothetical protein
VDKETATYIISYFSELLTENERAALKHHSSTIKLSDNDNPTFTKMYKQKGWLTDDRIVLDLLKDGYDNFEMQTAKRILADSRDKVFLNKCPKCGLLARTPKAKQCRHCGQNWADK